MTEQPVETEQQFLGNAPRQAYLPNGHRMMHRVSAPDVAEAQRAELEAAALPIREYELPGQPGLARFDRMLLEAERHATDGTRALSSGNLDEGIAWLQSALAFAQNYRHAVQFELVEG